ncbi:MAG: hypothetical protein KDK97_12455 [Verrucomicrobiales bacterium]|nr:hypothetical protein [Verrucomicrobiales bacterium]MCP5560587.1 hypothetical protein [Verrucomicrobiaceae bacterium]
MSLSTRSLPQRLLRAACIVALSPLIAVAQQAPAVAKPATELFLLVPEPRAMRTELSIVPEGSKETVLSPAREIAERPGLATYSKEAFERLGVGVDKFAERAKAAADRLLSTLQVEWIKGADGKVAYAVFRGDRPIMASLLVAPSLPKVFSQAFGKEIWLVLPDRHSLYVFPAKAEALVEFTGDLRERYENEPYAASCEVFEANAETGKLRVVASYRE